MSILRIFSSVGLLWRLKQHPQFILPTLICAKNPRCLTGTIHMPVVGKSVRGESGSCFYKTLYFPQRILKQSVFCHCFFSCFTYLHCAGKCSCLYWLGSQSVPVMFLKGSFLIPQELMAKLPPAVGRARLGWRLGLSVLVK